MALRTYTIELRVDFDDAEKHDTMLTIIRDQAKQIITSARLISDKRQPDIAIETGDMFIGAQEIELFKPGEDDL
jgi:hypothetical protein